MRDLWAEAYGGVLAQATASLATTGTQVYPGGALGTSYVDLGTISASSRFTLHTLFNGLYAVWRLITGAGGSGAFQPGIYHAANAAFNSGNEQLALYRAEPVGEAAGTVVRYRMPEQCKEFIVHSCLPTGTTVAYTIECFFEEGARQGPAL